uniref:Uncharacterized protein n=1 Tax=Chromera velia CCMP2878 TaxID=1169474 RepID=A0A0G4H4X5_9ALVE|eukprot:Cvel_24690.t1-p1 / transcript=Cvel_24690.t1 / gene=Cvel_24690 / organism=Chromera_velia_CCMP2878 / gene_product=hypothetical protein / transcript_product=hypothetical protein / location=Cvel_scaffold2706:8176-8646(-) / protein_length=157 / sequence_SO=supercontig / SO=protein_coding / is_pseudo=false
MPWSRSEPQPSRCFSSGPGLAEWPGFYRTSAWENYKATDRLLRAAALAAGSSWQPHLPSRTDAASNHLFDWDDLTYLVNECGRGWDEFLQTQRVPEALIPAFEAARKGAPAADVAALLPPSQIECPESSSIQSVRRIRCSPTRHSHQKATSHFDLGH